MAATGDDLALRLRDAAARVAERRRLDGELKVVDADLAVRRASDEKWRREAERAAEQLRWVRGWSWRAVLLRWRGLAGELRASAEAAIDAARREQEACELAMEPVLAARSQLAARVAALDGAEREHEELLAARERWLRDRRHVAIARIDELRARLDAIAAGRRSIHAAVGHAHDALVALREAREALGRSRPRGTNAWWRGGTWGTLVTSSRDRAAAAASERAANRLADLDRAVAQLRAIGVAGAVMPQLALGAVMPADAPDADARQHLTQRIEAVQQAAWSLERAGEAVHAAEQQLRAEHAACIEAAT